MGSGVIIDKEGHILTNHHVVGDMDRIKVILPGDDREYDAIVVGTDPTTDLAVIRIKDKPSRNLQPAVLGDSNALRVGDWVLAVGAPFGYEQTVTAGIISAKGRTGVEAGKGKFEDFLQTDAAINPGNSGGALVNMRGELVGINTAIASETGGYQGIGFAIPSSMASQISKTLLAQGKVVRGWLGVGIQDLTPDMAKALGVSSTNGVIVSNVIENGPAAKAGLQAGDVITAVDGKPVTEVNQLQTAVAMINPDSQTRLAIIRDNKPMTLAVTLGTREEQAQAATQQPGQPGQQRRTPAPQQVQDLTVAPLDNQTRQQLNLPSGVNGVVISDLNSTGPASAAGLAQGDVILTVNRKTVTSIADFNASYGKATGTVLLYIFRNGNYFFVTVNK
jgi:serine protease Do